MKAIKLIAAGIGLVTSMSSFAIGYDAITASTSGSRTTERHAFQYKTTPESCLNLAFCNAAQSNDSEGQIIMAVTNQTTCAGPSGACIAANVADTYVGTGGSATTGVLPVIEQFNIFSPECNFGVNPNCGRDLPLSTILLEWDFTTAPNGKIISGYMVGDSSFGGGPGTVGVFIFPEMILRSYRGGIGGLNIACAVDPATDPASCFTPADPSEATTGEFTFAYITVPMTEGALSKAVPVPAFAAAALGLGLVGITVLTGRRRQIK